MGGRASRWHSFVHVYEKNRRYTSSYEWRRQPGVQASFAHRAQGNRTITFLFEQRRLTVENKSDLHTEKSVVLILLNRYYYNHCHFTITASQCCPSSQRGPQRGRFRQLSTCSWCRSEWGPQTTQRFSTTDPSKRVTLCFDGSLVKATTKKSGSCSALQHFWQQGNPSGWSMRNPT